MKKQQGRSSKQAIEAMTGRIPCKSNQSVVPYTIAVAHYRSNYHDSIDCPSTCSAFIRRTPCYRNGHLMVVSRPQ
jgi:hypothetical protein